MDHSCEENVDHCWEQRSKAGRLSLFFSLPVSLFLDRAHYVLWRFTEAQGLHAHSLPGAGT